MRLASFVAEHFMNGNVLFPGLLLTSLAAFFRMYAKNRLLRSSLLVTAVLGAVLVVASATPFPLWVYGLWLAMLGGAWHFVESAKWSWPGIAAFVTASLCITAWELPFHLRPSLSVTGCDTLFVIGDSLSMGADPPGKNWPKSLGEKLGLTTQNLSHGGATVTTALPNAKRIDGKRPLVILEIGGNDLLANKGDFDENLSAMLNTVCQQDRLVMMIELPLPPSYNSYGMAQRKLARLYNVPLIPKRFLAHVLMAPGATVDGLHLSNKGHELLADTIYRVFQGR